MRAASAAGAGFLLAVLWFDLMFDVQVLRNRRAAELPDDVLASIAAYYRRVTTEARPMNRVIAVVMLATLVALAFDRAYVPLALAAVAIGTAGARTVRNAVRLGTRADPPVAQTALARSILRDHVFCLACIAAVVVVQIAR